MRVMGIDSRTGGDGWNVSARVAATALGIGLIVACTALGAAGVVAERVDVVVRDAHSGETLSDLRIDARRRIGEDLRWVARAYTDQEGRASFDLEGVDDGVTYVLSATPYNGGTVYGSDIGRSGPFEFVVGKLAVRVVAGGTESPLGDTRVDIREVLPDGTLKWRGRGTTDAQGLVRLDPPGLGEGRRFVLEARSPWDQSHKRSHEIREPSEITFVVGNAPLTVHLLDGISQEPLDGERLTAYERLADGSSHYAGSRTTDADGIAIFDLDGLGEGRSYFVRARVFSNATSYSPDLESPGELTFPVGTLSVAVIRGGNGEPIPDTKVWAYAVQDDGSIEYTRSGTTDGDGIVRFDLPGLGDGARYVLRTRSPVDGSKKQSNEITETGEMVFPVGNAPLLVTLANYLSRERLAGVRIWARERFEDGSTRGVSAQTTDDNGRAVFDLDGLGEGHVYYLSTTPYNGGRVTTDDLEAAGELLWLVGALEVTVVDGAEQLPLAGVRVYARERREDGKLVTRARGTTDDHGIIRFDPPRLGKGATYVLQANSPFDGSRKFSDDISEPGRRKFIVGNAPLEVSLVNGISGDPLADTRITAYEITAEKSVYAGRRITDSEGFATFDLDGLGDGRVYILRTTPYNGGRVDSEPLREGGHFEFRVGTFEVRVVSGADGSPLVDHKVWAYRLGEEGKLIYVRSGYTDEEATIRFDLPGLADGVAHVLRSRSPVNGAIKMSQPYHQIGKAIFRVGNEPLNVHLVNGIDGDPLSEKRIDAYERIPGEERLKWRARAETDDMGRAVFDLDGLGDGRVYLLRTTPYNAGPVYSQAIDEPGPFEFEVGTLRVFVTSGATGKPLVDFRVDAREITEDGHRWRARGTTDVDGVIHFDLPGLGSGRRFVLQARSPIDGTRKFSDVIETTGIVAFEVGNEPLELTAINGVSGEPIAELRITVREIIEGEKPRWISSLYTDAEGKVSFDIDGLGGNRRFALETRPYNGGSVRTDEIPSPGGYRLRLGTVPVALVDTDTGSPLPDVRLTAYEKLSDGKLHWSQSGTTDDLGMVRFDLPGVSRTLVPGSDTSGRRIYVFKAHNPFGEGKRYYSQFVDREGPVEFRVARDGDAPLDLTPPEIEITAPTPASTVDSAGFDVLGNAADNATLTQVEVTVTDPVIGATTIVATYDATSQRWTAAVPGTSITAGQPVTIVATATDQALNQASQSITVTPIADALPPQVTITSHADGDNVGASGFLLSGNASDDIGVVAIQATIDDPTVGQNTVSIGVANDGRWTLAVSGSQITEGERVQITIVASDAAGRQGSATIGLDVIAVDFATRHLINRITYGATPDLLLRVEAMGADAFLAEQLDPASIDDSALATRLPGTPVEPEDLQATIVLRAAYSQRQLLEVMTQFWDNHFNTNLATHDDVGYEVAENDAFRANALGRFRDLLEASAKSPAMLIYLDQANSVAANPNENYPREVMELHTLRVDGPYTQDDVEALARILTGWTVRNGAFFFDGGVHDFGNKTFLGIDFPAGQGLAEGERALDILASHPSTANFICEKLAVVFISDTPPGTAIARCAGVFLQEAQNPNQLREVLRSILTSPEFADPASFRSKIRTPLEYIVSLVRNLGATTDGYSLLHAMSGMSMRLLFNPVPTGYSETGDDWTNADQALQRIRSANSVIRGTTSGTAISVRDLFLAQGQVTTDGIVPFALRLFFHDDYTALDERVARDVLTDGGSVTFDINAGDAETRLRRMMATLASFPGYQFQ